MWCYVTSLIIFLLSGYGNTSSNASHFHNFQLLNVPTAQTVRGSQSVAADDAVPSGSSRASGGVLRSVIIAPPSDQPRDAASSASGMRKGMLSISSHFGYCILSIPSVTANIE
jgi:hypothetical protein